MTKHPDSGSPVVQTDQAIKGPDIHPEIISLLKSIFELEDLTIKQLVTLRTCRYLLVLDMGCGSTSGAIVVFPEDGSAAQVMPLTWDFQDKNPMTGEIRPVNEWSIPTIIGYAGANVHIGPVALGSKACCENFKACPTENHLGGIILQETRLDGSVRRFSLEDVWKDYFHKILQMMLEKADQKGFTIKPGENIMVMVAHPAGLEWSEPSILRRYRELIAKGIAQPADDALSIEEVLTISEAKAAMQFVRRAGTFPQTLDFSKGVIIVDIGASTIDIEYLISSRADPIEFSLTMAGRDADRLLAHYILEQAFPSDMQNFPGKDQIPDEAFFTSKKLKRSEFLYQIRIVKEGISNLARQGGAIDTLWSEVYIGDQSFPINDDILRVLLGDPITNPLNGLATGNRKISVAYDLPMALTLGKAQQGFRAIQQVEDTWYGHLENLIKYVLETLERDGHHVGQVIVTGGSCRLTGVNKHILNALKATADGRQIVKDQADKVFFMANAAQFETAVPVGGGYYISGIMQHMDDLIAFPNALNKLLQTDLPDKVSPKLTEALNDLIRQINLEALNWWCKLSDGNANTSWNGLATELNRRYHAAAKFGRFARAISSALADLNPEEVLPETLKGVRELLAKLAQIEEFTGELQMNTVRVDVPEDMILGAITALNPANLITGLIANLKTFVKNLGAHIARLWRKDSDPNTCTRSKKDRENVRDTYQNSTAAALPADFTEQVKKLVLAQCKKTNCFGLPGQLIRDLKDHIIRALFMS